MAVQTVNTYAFNVKRKSLMTSPGVNSSTNADAGIGASSGMSPYTGEQVAVVATSLANAIAVLTSYYSTDLGPYSGGAQLVNGALTSLA